MKASMIFGAAVLLASPAFAQSVDPLAAHRLQMDQQRARTEVQAATAATFRADTAMASQHLQATTRSDLPTADRLTADAAARRDAREQEALRRREAEARDAALDLERRIRPVELRGPR